MSTFLLLIFMWFTPAALVAVTLYREYLKWRIRQHRKDYMALQIDLVITEAELVVVKAFYDQMLDEEEGA